MPFDKTRTTIALAILAMTCAGVHAAKPSAKSKYDGVEIKVLTDRTSDGLMQPLFEAFERDTGIEIEAVFLDEGLVARLESRPTEADVVITKDAELIELAKRKGLLAKLESAPIDKAIPAQFRDKDGEYFVDAYRARGIIVSKDRVKPGAIQTYEDLAKPEWRGKVCSRSGKHDYNIAIFDQMLKAWGDEKGHQVIAGIAKNLARAPEGDDREQAKAIMEGVCDVALLNSYYYPKMFEHKSQARWGQATNYVFPDQASDGAFIMRSAVALTRATENRGAARMFAEYIASEKVQKMIVERTKQYSVLPSVTPHSSLVQMGTAQGIKGGRIKINFVSLEGMADKRQEAIKFVEEIKYDNGPAM
jgi:iron(III) transport system substrate-binding protein